MNLTTKGSTTDYEEGKKDGIFVGILLCIGIVGVFSMILTLIIK